MVIALAMLPGVTGAKPVRKLQKVSAHTNTLTHAEELATKGKWNQAIAMCDKLTARNSAQTRPALLLKAKCLECADSPEEALACYRRILKEYPRAIDAKEIQLQTIRLSALELLQPQGIAELEVFIQKNPNSPLLRQARWWRAGVAFKQREWALGQSLFTAILKDYPQAPETESARECLRECEAKLAELAALDKRRAAAIAAAKVAAEKAELPRETLRKLREGRAAMEKTRFRDAIAAFEAVRKAGPSPDYEPALLELGQTLAQIGKPDEALAAWEEALKNGTNVLWLDDCLLAKGRLLLEEKGQDKAAEALFRELPAKYPESPLKSEAYVRLGLALLLQERPREAETAIQNAKKARPQGPPNPWDELDRLLKVCEGDTSLWPDRAKLRADAASRRETLRGDLLFANGDYDKARQVYERVAAGSKDLETGGRAWLQAGRCWNCLHRYDKALSCYERFLASPYDKSDFADDALLRAGVIYVGPLGQSRKGKALYERILERYPGGDYAEMAELYLCTLAYWEKDWRAALTLHEAFLRRYPDSPNAWFVRRERLPTIQAALAGKKTG